MSIRDHVKAEHPRLKLRRSNRDLAREHGRAHLHSRFLHHYHGEAELKNRGTGHVPGWTTGEDMVRKDASWTRELKPRS